MPLNTFRRLFDDDKKVTIPMIQRDYAQGRKKELKIREGFVKSLEDLINGKGGSLDFIYGALDNGVFTPLDGQQRLTTLYLLYWLAAKRESVDEAQYIFLKRFSYQTRPNSKFFCQHLFAHTPSADDDIAHDIRSQKWYRLEWNNDPTVDSMLRMLQFLDSRFYPDKDSISPIWDRLENIKFYCFDIENLGLTDDIYIKMNSRGKPLTNFEHFKAAFDKASSSRLAVKIDKDYTDRMWHLGSNSPHTASLRAKNPDLIPDVDRYLLNFIKVVARCITLSLYGTEPPASPMDWISDIYTHPSAVTMLERAFDAICTDEAADVFEKFFSRDDSDPEKINIDNINIHLLDTACIIGPDMGYAELLLLYAILLYLANHNTFPPSDSRYITEQQMQRRLRIARNLLKNSHNQLRPERYRAIFREVGELILHGTLNESRTALNENQKKEEIAKTAYISQNPQAEKAIAAIENHPLLLGALSAIGWTKPELFDTFRLAFTDYPGHSPLLTRAILCHGDIASMENWWRYRIGVGKNGGENLWRAVLFVNKDNSKIKDVLPAFLSDYAAKAQAGQRHADILKAIISEYNPDHLGHISYIIRYSSILSKSEYGKFYIDDEMGWVALYTRLKPGRHAAIMHLAVMQACEKAGLGSRLNLGEYLDNIQVDDSDTFIDATKRDAVHVLTRQPDGTMTETARYPLPPYGTVDIAHYIASKIIPQILSPKLTNP